MRKDIRSKAKRSGRHGAGPAFDRLVRIMAILRAPGGCPWDRKQTHRSLLPYLIEETYELKDAILRSGPKRVREELGDLLLQIIFHAQLADERGRFSAADVADGISDKLVRRHPHVFGSGKRRISARMVLINWERLKISEKPAGRRSVLDGVPRSLPALLRAYRVQEKVAQYGFDWQQAEEVEAKLREEVNEFHRALKQNDRRAAADELGDLLFTLVNLARHLRVDPETALDATSHKFARRFAAVERNLRRRGLDPAHVNLETLEAEWQAVKKSTSLRRRPARRGVGHK